MTIVVESGQGVASPIPNSYSSSVDCLAFATERGLVYTDDATGEAALIRATAWLDASFRPYWPGARTNGRSQWLQWPRYNTGSNAEVEDVDGNPIANDEIPMEVVEACQLAAIYEQANPGGLTPILKMVETIKSASVYQAVTVTYASSSSSAEDARTLLTSVTDALAQLIGDINRVQITGQSTRV